MTSIIWSVFLSFSQFKFSTLVNPPSWDHFCRHGAYILEVSLNQKSWLLNRDQAKTLTWRVGLVKFQKHAKAGWRWVVKIVHDPEDI